MARFLRRKLGDDALVGEEHSSAGREMAELDFDIEAARRTLAQMEVDTWGTALLEIEGERFVVLPFGTLDNPAWTVRDRPALKLSRE